MNLLNEAITHKVFGDGEIIEQDESFITIEFDNDTKKFVYPDAFGTFITLKDQEIKESLKEIIKEREIEQAAIEKKEQEEKERRLLELQRQEKMRNYKIHESSQIVFWLDDEEQENVFTDWKVSTGEIQSGKNKGKPNKPARLRLNSAGILTKRDPDESETDRQILGLYMVSDELVDDIEEGLVPAHEEYRIKLTDEESEKMLFWNYYINKSYPHRTTWNSGKFRYFDNVWTAQILKDIIALKTDEEEINAAQKFLEYFCEMNALDINNIPEPSGALREEVTS